MLDLCDLVFTFSVIFITINHMISVKQTHLLLAHFLGYLLDDNMDRKTDRFQIA